MLTSLQTPSACLSIFFLQWTFTQGRFGKTQMETQCRCACINPCLHQACIYGFCTEVEQKDYKLCCHMPYTSTYARIHCHYTVITCPAPSLMHQRRTPCEPKSACLNLCFLCSCRTIGHDNTPCPIYCDLFTADQVPSLRQCCFA